MFRIFPVVQCASVILAVCSLISPSDVLAAEPAIVIPAPAVDDRKAAGPLQTAVLAGGCFWGVQGVFQHVRGVDNAVSGYAGGRKRTADYETVSTGTTGHAESVEITFDPSQVTYGELLQIFFSVVHDPTQLNRQGPDTGTQYRSAIFYTDEAQKHIAEAYITQLGRAKVYDGAIVTRVEPLAGFYPAERYHQNFLVEHPRYPYIVINDLPKIRNLKRLFPDDYREQAATVQAAR